MSDILPGELSFLKSRTGARVLLPGDRGWDDAVLLWNGMITTTPALVVQPASADDVAAAIRFAHEAGLQLSVKGSGHNIAGTAIADGGLTLDMSRMRAVTVDPAARLAHVQPGCLLREVDAATQQHGLATVLGFVSGVGVAGLTLGGGLGCLTRRFGWTVDNLEEAEIVTADGRIQIANRSQNAELFWALRGGGGNFGVVTRFTFNLHEVGPSVYGGLIAWPFERAAEILPAYREITEAAPRELTVWLVQLQAPPAPFIPPDWHGRRICVMPVYYTGDLAKAEQAVAPIRALRDPVLDLLHEQPYREIQSYLDDIEPNGHHYYWRTGYLTGLSDDLLATIADVAGSCPIPRAQVGLLHVAGAVNDHDEDDGCVGNRDARYVVGVNGIWEPGEPGAAGFRQWIRDTGDRVLSFTSGRSYVNFQTADETSQRVRATYGGNYPRLTAVKKSYDPGNFFRINRNIPPG